MNDLTRPIMGIENRTPLEVFAIMCDRIQHTADKEHPRFVAGYQAGLKDAQLERPAITQGDIDMAKHHARVAYNDDGNPDPLEAALSKMVECLKP